ncbi:MAG: hypothetical protein GQ533_03230 [Methanosarcinaceae archaeon]|nr:hypothetical protein [Methanosarcinaceae archaeon]
MVLVQGRPMVVDDRNVVDAAGFIGEWFVYMKIGRGDRNGRGVDVMRV